MEKRYNFRIYPTASQEARIRRCFGCCRFVHNRYLAKHIETYEKERRFLGLDECEKDLALLKKEKGYEWLAEADANALLGALKDLDRAYRAFFRGAGKGGATGFPKFKGKRGRQSYRSRKNINRRNVEVGENSIKLTKLGLVRCRTSRPVEGRVLSATVFLSRSGKYFVSVLCTDVATPRPLPKTGASVTLRLGAGRRAASDGTRLENPGPAEKHGRMMARLSRRLSRKSKDGRNREKARLRLARAHEKAANRRTDRLNKLSTRLVRENDAIRVERDPRPEGGRRAARLAADAGRGALVRMLRRKCEWYGRGFEFICAPPHDPAKPFEGENAVRPDGPEPGEGRRDAKSA
jgi:putative transposase